ncbi:cholestenol delta-isomerase [Emydomyces testavorans]|uniref:Cholestenol delta-isomerase n=1 Tax=Emydomyces testavorans TaxID=2070801 RepID=A0AAF0IHG7_9EURO|nr:cholestenol delta-isomerase [Emydomyces testavorans]
MANSTTPAHPYYPVEAKLIGYLANEWSVPVLIGAFGVAWGAILLAALGLVTLVRPTLPKAEKLAVLWFVLSGSIHLFFEGYFVVNHTRMAPAQDLFGQLWKEYSLSDSRYLTSDPFVLCMETITAVCLHALKALRAHRVSFID